MCGFKGLDIGACIGGPGLGFSTFGVLRGVGEARGSRGELLWFTVLGLGTCDNGLL